MTKFFFSIILLLIAIEFGLAYKTGAPVEVCESMIPEHGIPPQTGASPFTLTVDKSKVKAGSKLTVKILTTPKSGTFKGFLIQARNNANETLGTFSQVSGSKVINCPSGTKNAITHDSPNERTSISIPWTAPSTEGTESIYFIATIAKNGEKFWVGIRSRRVILE